MRAYLLSLLIMIVVACIHSWGMKGNYVRFQWLDIVSHSLVCFGIALCIGQLVSDFLPRISRKRTLIILATLFVGILWELLEIQYNITGHPLWSYEFYFDTTKDLIVDTIGAAIATFIVVRPISRKVEIHTQ
jgi:hypothetical protein